MKPAFVSRNAPGLGTTSAGSAAGGRRNQRGSGSIRGGGCASRQSAAGSASELRRESGRCQDEAPKDVRLQLIQLAGVATEFM